LRLLGNNNQTARLSQINTAPSYNYLSENNSELYEKLLKTKENQIISKENQIIIFGRQLKKTESQLKTIENNFKNYVAYL